MDYVTLLLKPKGNIWMELRDYNLPTCPLKAKTLLNMLFFFFLAPLSSLQDLSSPARNQTQAPSSESTVAQPVDPRGTPKCFPFGL